MFMSFRNYCMDCLTGLNMLSWYNLPAGADKGTEPIRAYIVYTVYTYIIIYNCIYMCIRSIWSAVSIHYTQKRSMVDILWNRIPEGRAALVPVLLQRQISNNDFGDDQSSGGETQDLLHCVLKVQHGFLTSGCTATTAAASVREGQFQAMTTAQAGCTPRLPSAATAGNTQSTLHTAKYIAMKFAISG